MAMFGQKAPGATAGPPRSFGDVLSIIGATLKDASPGSSGDALSGVQQMMAGRQQLAQKQAFLQQLSGALQPQYDDGSPPPTVAPRGLIGGQAASAAAAPIDDPSAAIGAATGAIAPTPAPQTPAPYTYQPPQRTSNGLSINDPRLAALTVAGQQVGVPLDGLNKLLTAQQAHVTVGPGGEAFNDKDSANIGRTFRNPTAVANTIVDLNNPNNENRVIPEAPVKGAMPVYDNRSQVVDWRLPSGAADTIAGSAQAQQTGQTMGTVYNRPNPGGSTTPVLGRDMFGAGGGASGGGGGGGAGFTPRTLSPGEIDAQKVDFTAGANTVANAGDARIKAANTAQQYTQAFNDASALDTNNLTNFKLGTAKILRSIGVNNPNLENFTNTAEGYRQLTTQMVLPLAKELGSNPSNRDAQIIQNSMPGLKTPRQTAMVTFASQAALQNKEAARQDFFANYEGPQSKSSMQKAWSSSDASKRSIFQDPIFQRLQIQGKPAVTIYSQPYRDGKTYGVFRPGTPFEQIFEVH